MSPNSEGGGNFDLNVSTDGFSEVDTIKLLVNGSTADEESPESDGDVSEDYTINVPQATCAGIAAFVWGLGPDNGPSYASGSTFACNNYTPPPGPVIQILTGGPTGNLISGTTQNATIGKLVNLYGWVLNGQGPPVAGYSWILPGKTVGSWNADTQAAQTASLLQAPEGMNSQNVSFAWSDELTSGAPVTLQVTFTDGSVAEASVVFVVWAPNAPIEPTILSAQVGPNSMPYSGKQALYLGSPTSATTPGIDIQNQASPMTPGQFEWVQVINSALIQRYNIQTGQWEHVSASGLDTSYPYPTALDGGANDSPATLLQTCCNEYTYAASFTTYLMFRPSSTDIWVPLCLVNWTWSGAAYSPPGGPWAPEGVPTAAASPGTRVYSQYPSWTTNAANQQTWLPGMQ